MPTDRAPAHDGGDPTTGASVLVSASRTPGTARMIPIETTGLDGGNSTRSADSMASSTPGAGPARSMPTTANRSAMGAARSRTHHS